MLNLPQQLLLLAFHEKKANKLNTPLSLGLAGAILGELLIQNKICRNGGKLSRRDQVRSSPREVWDPVLLDAFLHLPGPGHERPAKECVIDLSRRMKRLKPRLTEQLVAKNLLAETGERSLGLFNFKNFCITKPDAALAIKDELRQVVFRPFGPNPRQLAIMGLIKPAGLKIFTREEGAAVKQRMAEVLNHDVISDAVAAAGSDAARATARMIAASVAATA